MIGSAARSVEPDLEIGDVVPLPQFMELHARFIPASPEAVWSALHRLSVSDVPTTRVLMGARLLLSGTLVRPGLRNRRPGRTLWDALPLPVLHELEPVYVLAAGMGRPWTRTGRVRAPADALDLEQFCAPGWAKVAMDFRLVPTADGTVLTTETRVVTTDAVARWRFAAYWILIRAFSGLIRRDILAAVDRAATRARSGSGASPWT